MLPIQHFVPQVPENFYTKKAKQEQLVRTNCKEVLQPPDQQSWLSLSVQDVKGITKKLYSGKHSGNIQNTNIDIHIDIYIYIYIDKYMYMNMGTSENSVTMASKG